MDDIVVRVEVNGTTMKVLLSSLSTRIASNEVHSLRIWFESSDDRVKLIIQSISKVLPEGSCLTSLAFWGSSFKDTAAIIIAAELFKFSSLTALHIAKFGNKGARALCEALVRMPNITRVTLGAPFSDHGVEDVILLMERNTKLLEVDISSAIVEAKTYQHLLQVLKFKLIQKFGFPDVGDGLENIPIEWLEDCFSVNTTLTHTFSYETFVQTIKWYLDRNKACAEVGAGKVLRDSIPYDMRTYEEMKKFVAEQVKLTHHIVMLREKEIARNYLDKAHSMVDQVRPSEAMILLQCALELDESEDFEKVGLVLTALIEEQMKLSEHDKLIQIEMRIATIKEEILHAEQQATKVRSQEEAKMIEQQKDVLQRQEEQLKARLDALDIHQKEAEEREARVQKKDSVLSDQTKLLIELLSELAATTTDDLSTLKQQMSAVVSGDQDVDAARRRCAGLQKVALEAQKRLEVEEKRQRERMEWMRRQMELFNMKGMTPSQLSFRNYLMDVKRLSLLRNLKDLTPHPLHCFIIYAWEIDDEANTDLERRLQRLKEELKVAGMEVTLETHDIDMKRFMMEGIENAHKVLLICTPLMQERAAETTTNNIQLALEKAMEKAEDFPEFIVPLIMSGTYRDAMPTEVEHLLPVYLTPQTDYYAAMASITPTGLIPMLLGLEDNKDYKQVHDRLFGDLEEHSKQQAKG